MTIQKGKKYRLKENVYGFDKEVKIESIDNKYIKLIGLNTHETMYLNKNSFGTYFEEIRDEQTARSM